MEIKIKKKTIYIVLGIIAAIVLVFFIHKVSSKPIYQFNGDTFSYSQARKAPEYQMTLNRSTDTLNIYNINFLSRSFANEQTRIYGLLLMPKSSSEKSVPGLVLLPGGSVTKESESELGEKIANLGYAVLTIDQRGVGQTGGTYLWVDQDYLAFSQGYEPIQHLSVYDGLASTDILRTVKGIDKNNIAIGGESMGGRYAIIAAAIDKRLRGALVISSAGFNIQREGKAYDNYILSVDPDHYVSKISPRKLFMLHGDNDSVVNITQAENTFSLAGEPKSFFVAQGCPHGYCPAMYDALVSDLKDLFS